MRQLTFVGPGQLAWEEVPTPELSGGGDALVRPIAVATCDLDAAVITGRASLPGPFALGHEFVAEVVEVADGVDAVHVGDRVIVRIPFADAMLVPLPSGVEAAGVASVSDNVPDGWRAVAPGLEAEPAAPVLVVGGGGDVALYAVAVAVALGSTQVDYVDTDERRLRVAEAVGANPVEQAPDGTRLGRYPVTVDHSGTAAGLHSAIRSTEPEGVCTSTAIYFDAATPVPLFEMYTRGITFRTGRVNARAVLPRVLELVVDGRLHPELVTAATVPWADADTALADLDAKTVVVRE